MQAFDNDKNTVLTNVPSFVPCRMNRSSTDCQNSGLKKTNVTWNNNTYDW